MLHNFVARLVGNHFFKTRIALATGLYLALSTIPVLSQTTQALHWINDSSQNGFTTLNSTSNFITSFKDTNDVQIALLSGKVNSIFQEAFAGLANNNNPGFLTNFIGLAANGTGDGTFGHINFLESTLSGEMVLRFTFSIPLTPNDRFLLTDVDNGERYNIQAFSGNQAVDLSGWTYTSYSGEESQLPNANWPTWTVDTTNGSLIANSAGNLTEPLSVLTPDRSIDSVLVTHLAQGSGSSAIQFVNLTSPVGLPTLQILPANGNVVLAWPGAFNNYALYTATNLAPPVTWSAIGTAPSLNQTTLVSTNSTSTRTRFYRLQIK